GRQRLAAALLMDDLRFAAWFLWMTPLEAALSSLRLASRARVLAASLSPAATASRNLRTAVFRPLLTALLRSRAISFWRFRLIWDLMLATELRLDLSLVRVDDQMPGQACVACACSGPEGRHSTRDRQRYQRPPQAPKSCARRSDSHSHPARARPA